MKIIRLIPGRVYGPFPKHVLLVSEFSFSPRVAATWIYYTLDNTRWLVNQKLQNAYVLIARPIDDDDCELSDYDYRIRIYKFIQESHNSYALL